MAWTCRNRATNTDDRGRDEGLGVPESPVRGGSDGVLEELSIGISWKKGDRNQIGLR